MQKVYKKKVKEIFLVKNRKDSKDKLFYLKKNNFKFLIKKKINCYNIFFNINYIQDDLYYLFYDVGFWDQTKVWFLFKPHYLSYYFRWNERKKWLYARLMNITVKKIQKKSKRIKQNFKNYNIFSFWKKSNYSILLNKIIQPYYLFKCKIIIFKFQRFFFSFNIKNLEIIYFSKYIFNKLINFKNKNIFFNLKIFKNCLIFFYINYFKLAQQFISLKQNNKNFLNSTLKPNLFLCFKIYIHYLCDILFKNIYKYWIKIKIITYNFLLKIKEKHELKNILIYNLVFKKIYGKITNLRNIIREVKVYLKFLSKKRLRFKKGEKKIIKYKEKKKKRKKRTNLQIYLFFVKKIMFIRKYLWYIININFNKYKNYFDILFLIFSNNKWYNYKFQNFFFNEGYYINELFIDIDSLYVYYLPIKKQIHYIPMMSIYDWKGNYNRNMQSYYKFKGSDLVQLKDRIVNTKIYNKINIMNIYKLLLNDKNLNKKNKIKFFFKKNIFVFLRFLNYNLKFEHIYNLEFIFNIYFWIILFLKKTNKANILNLRKILDITSFLNLLKILYINKFNWFNLKNFDIYLHILTVQNFIIKLKCKLNLLLQEACIYLYYKKFKIECKTYEDSIYSKLNQLKLVKNIQYVFTGTLNFEINSILFLNLMQVHVGTSFFLQLIKNFLDNCELSVSFIKNYLKLYWILLEFMYKFLDNYIINLLNNFNSNLLQNKIFYLRYKNNILIYTLLSSKFLLYFIFEKFLFIYLYYFLKFYFIFCAVCDLEIQHFEFMYYIIKKNKKKQSVNFNVSVFSFVKLLFFFNLLQKKQEKLIFKFPIFLLNSTVIRIFNFFNNLWMDIYYYYNFVKIKNLKLLRQLLYKICFLTIFIKLKNNQKLIDYIYFKKIFKFKYNYSNEIVNYNKLNIYIINQNNLNLKKWLLYLK